MTFKLGWSEGISIREILGVCEDNICDKNRSERKDLEMSTERERGCCSSVGLFY